MTEENGDDVSHKVSDVRSDTAMMERPVVVIAPNCEEHACRICQSGQSLEALISPCRCKGSLGFVHRACLQTWLGQSGATCCEICREPYRILMLKEYRPFCDWLRFSVTDRQILLLHAGLFFLLLPFFAANCWSFFVGISGYVRYEKAKSYKSKQVSLSLIVMSTMIILSYIALAVFSIRCHFKAWRKWRNSNCHVTIVGFRTDLENCGYAL